MRILWMSDSPTTPSGYGNVTRFVCAGLAERGYQVSILGWQTKGQPIPWQNCMLYPSSFNTDELLKHLRQLRPDVLVIQTDVMWLAYLNYPAIADFMRTAGITWAFYYPLEGDMGEKRLPPTWVRILKTVGLPIAMSRYTRDVTQANGVEPAYIPLGVDTRVFRTPADKELAKQAFGYEEKFVVLSDARNQLRKMLPRTLEIFRRFAADKEDVVLHLHCDPDDPYARTDEYCYDLRSDIALLKLADKVHFTKDMSFSTGGLSLEQLANIYQAADVHLLASCGEGFGLPTLQAAATGVVPLAADYGSNQELVSDHGEAISIRHFLPGEFGIRRGIIDIEDAVSKLEKLYRDRQLLACEAQRAREFALSYDWEGIVSQWEQLLEREVACVKACDIPDNPCGEEGVREEESPSDLAPEERKASELVTELLQEAQVERAIRIPVTLPLVSSKQRVTGCVYAASQRDVPIVLALHRIFPSLNVWSTVLLDFGSSVSNGKSLQAKVVEANSPQYRPHLAVSTLALDIASFDPRLPVEAAKLGVPCIGLAQQGEQARLWPELSLEKPDPLMAAELGRQMLTDQGVAAEVCMCARQRLAGVLTPVIAK